MDLITPTPVPGDLHLVPHQASLVSVVKQRSLLHPEKNAFSFLVDGKEEEVSISYGELDASARNIAMKLTEHGLKGKKVLLFYPAGLDFILAFFGCLYASVIPVTAYPPKKNRSLQRIHAIISDCSAVSILTTETIIRSMERNFSSDPLLNSLTWMDTNSWLSGTAVESHSFEPGFEDLAFLQYTSGSTGQPKGVMVSHRNIMYNLRSLQILFQITPADVAVHWVPQFHDLGLVFGILETVFSGSSSVLISPLDFIADPICLLQTITRHHATLSGQPDFAYLHCVGRIEEARKRNLDLSSLRVLYSGAEPVRKQTLDLFLEAFSPCGLRPETFTPGYGMAESTLILTVADVTRVPHFLEIQASALGQHQVKKISKGDRKEDVRIITGNGKTSLDTVVLIVDPETKKILAEDRVGEIWGSGSTIALGYYNNPQLTEEVFRASPAGQDEPVWLRTGDLGFLHEGELFITGRLKDLIIIRGRNFYPQDIETVVEEAHAAIRKTCTAAFSVEENGRERLALVAELRRSILPQDHDKIMADILAAVSREFEIQPARVTLIRSGAILKTSSGKIMRKAVREALCKGQLEIISERFFPEREIPQTDFFSDQPLNLEQFLIHWVTLRLNEGNPINPDSSLAAYGIDSLKALELTELTKTTFGFEWPPYLFFEEMSILQMAAEGRKLIVEN